MWNCSSFQAEYSKEESKDIWSPEALECIDAGKPLSRLEPVKLAKDRFEPKTLQHISAVSYTKKLQVVTGCSFSMHP